MCQQAGNELRMKIVRAIPTDSVSGSISITSRDSFPNPDDSTAAARSVILANITPLYDPRGNHIYDPLHRTITTPGIS